MLDLANDVETQRHMDSARLDMEERQKLIEKVEPPTSGRRDSTSVASPSSQQPVAAPQPRAASAPK